MFITLITYDGFMKQLDVELPNPNCYRYAERNDPPGYYSKLPLDHTAITQRVRQFERVHNTNIFAER